MAHKYENMFIITHKGNTNYNYADTMSPMRMTKVQKSDRT